MALAAPALGVTRRYRTTEDPASGGALLAGTRFRASVPVSAENPCHQAIFMKLHPAAAIVRGNLADAREETERQGTVDG
jgi:hypothetical protein